MTIISSPWVRRVVILSCLLLFFTVPHTLEDFATGEPAEAGVPAPVLSLVISMVLALQAVGLYWLGQRRRRGLFVHVAIGVFWPVASAVAQLPTVFSESPYRSGAISVLYIAGIIVVGILVVIASLLALRAGTERG